MRKRTNFWALAACVAATPFVSTGAAAGQLDGSSDMVCAVTDVVACLENANCAQGQARDFELPEIMVIDSKQKVVRGALESGEKAVSHPQLADAERSGDHLILQGVENGRSWDIAINTSNGKMSASLVGDGVSFLTFGICTAP